MDYVSLAGIAVGLSMDAFAVSITNGATTRRVNFGFAAKLAVMFGFFQALMPFLGWLIGSAGKDLIRSVDHWIALLLLAYLGIQMMLEARAKNNACEITQDDIRPKTLLMLAVATSIDALATGIILPSAVGASTVALMLLSVCLIGLITLFLCFAGVYAGKKFGCLLSNKAETLGGIVLIAIGIKIFVEHVFFGQG